MGDPSGILGVSFPIAELTDDVEGGLSSNTTPNTHENLSMPLKG